MRIIFMGTPDFSVPALDALMGAGHEIAAVYTQPPRPAGRGKKERPGPVHARALTLGLDAHCPVSFSSDQACQQIAGHQADIAVVVAYGLILPQMVLDTPRLGCVNIHASLLPRWRGAAPVHRAIMAGDGHSGVCIMQMEAGLDTGPVLLREATKIAPDETTGMLHDRLAQMGADLIVQALGDLPALHPQPQPTAGTCYAAKIAKSEAQIDWSRPAAEVDRHIRGLSPFPGAWCEANGARIKVLGSTLSSGSGRPGTVLNTSLDVACGQGAVRLSCLQKSGRAAQNTPEFLRGTPLPPGMQL